MPFSLPPSPSTEENLCNLFIRRDERLLPPWDLLPQKQPDPPPTPPKLPGQTLGGVGGKVEEVGTSSSAVCSRMLRRSVWRRRRGRPLRANLRGHNLIPKKLPTLPHCQKIIICTSAATLIFQNVQDENRRAVIACLQPLF